MADLFEFLPGYRDAATRVETRVAVSPAAAIVAGGALGLVPALIAKKLINGLSAYDATFGYIVVLAAFGFGAAIVNGIVNVAGSDLVRREHGGLTVR